MVGASVFFKALDIFIRIPKYLSEYILGVLAEQRRWGFDSDRGFGKFDRAPYLLCFPGCRMFHFDQHISMQHLRIRKDFIHCVNGRTRNMLS